MAARIACVGSGFIAGKHLAALTSLPDVQVVAVADTVLERAQGVADGLGARAYADGSELLATEELDAVWFCVPPFAHGRLEEAAVERDLPFFVEKPLAHDLATATTIAEEVGRRGLLTSVGYHWRYLDVVEAAAARCREAPPVLATGCWLDRTPSVAWWVDRTSSGGQVVEQTTHLFDLARHLLGEVEEVRALELQVGTSVPVASTAQLRFRSGCLGTITSARTLHTRHQVALQVVGDGYAMELSEASLTDHQLVVADHAGTRTERVLDDPVLAEDRAFVDAVLGRGDDVRTTYAEALCSHSLAWAADLSAREGRPVAPQRADVRA
jgi:myo-inositol 2-dehydrogenase/D-chiro-inositol 1-dehydrogenase